MQANLTPLATGTKVASIGTFYPAEVVSSTITERGTRKTVLRWTDSIPAARVYKGDTTTWVHVPGRTPRFIVTADN